MSATTRTRRAEHRARVQRTHQRRNQLLQLAARVPLTPSTETAPTAPSTQLRDLATGHLTAPATAPETAPTVTPTVTTSSTPSAPAATASLATPETAHTITLTPEEGTELVRASCSCGDWVQPNATAQRYAKAAGTRHKKATEDA